MEIVIAGRTGNTENYERFFRETGEKVQTSLSMETIRDCDGMVLPGGGDITPAFFGEQDHGSRNIDTELDLLQRKALEVCMEREIPVLGICKGMQLINVALGGDLYQNLETAGLHCYRDGDQYHAARSAPASLLAELYGEQMTVNSAHHQGIRRTGRGLLVIQRSLPDGCAEAICHESLPILGLQWHPERMDPLRAGTDGRPVLGFFLEQIQKRLSK